MSQIKYSESNLTKYTKRELVGILLQNQEKMEFHPATFEVVEHHVAMYCGNGKVEQLEVI